MTYEEFCKQYVDLIKLATGNITDQKQSEYASQLCDLTDSFPHYESRIDADDALWDSLRTWLHSR